MVVLWLAVVGDEIEGSGREYCGIRDGRGKEALRFAARTLARSWAEAVEGWVRRTMGRRCFGGRVGKAWARSMAWDSRIGSSGSR